MGIFVTEPAPNMLIVTTDYIVEFAVIHAADQHFNSCVGKSLKQNTQ